MRLVIDANIIFAALIKEGMTAELILREDIQLFSPEFLLDEIKKYRNLIIEKTHRSVQEFERFLTIISENIIIIPKEQITPFFERSEKISPDPKDTVYLALAMALKSFIWSNDKKLKEEQDKILVLSTSDLIEKLNL